MIGRRGVLTLGAVSALTACTRAGASPAATTPPSADEVALRRAGATAGTLAQAATTLPSPAQLLRRVATVQQAHLTALGDYAQAPTASPTPSATTSTPATLGQLVSATWAGARAALHDGETATDPAFALLLVRIAADRAASADLLAAAARKKAYGELKPSPRLPTPGPAPTSTSSTDTKGIDQLDRLLAGEHAAVFAYPLVIARTSGARQALARELWAEHRRERDTLETVILGTGRTPVAAEPAYEVGDLPASGSQAAALAARVEEGLTALAADVVAAATGSKRVIGAQHVVLGARRTAAWTGRPGLLVPEPAGGSTPSPSVT